MSEPPKKLARISNINWKFFDNGITYAHAGRNILLVHMDTGASLPLLGKCKLVVIKGSVLIMGYELKNGPVTICCPSGNYGYLAAEPREVLPLKYHGQELHDLLHSLSTELPHSLPCRGNYIKLGLPTVINYGMDELDRLPGAIVVVAGYDNTWCEGMRNYSYMGNVVLGSKPTGLDLMKDNVLDMSKNTIALLGFRFLKTNDNYNSLLNCHPDWEKVSNVMSLATNTVACFGGKGTGKSTFCRWLSNQLMTRSGDGTILFIDLDPGQSEFTPPGLISVTKINGPVFGPNYSHFQKSLMSVYVGTVSINDDPMNYLCACQKLAEFVDLFPTKDFCIINTAGFCEGLGFDVAVAVIKLFTPNVVVQITSPYPRRCFPAPLNPSNIESCSSNISPHVPNMDMGWYNLFFAIESFSFNNAIKQCTLPPRVLRDTSFISYFAPTIGSSLYDSPRCTFNLESVCIGCPGQMSTSEAINNLVKSELLALCVMPSRTISHGHRNTDRDCLVQFIKFGQNVQQSDNIFCGYALIEWIDMALKIMSIWTPLQKTELDRVNCIIPAGTLGCPASFCEELSKCSLLEDSNALNLPSRRQFIPNRSARHNFNI